MRKRLYEHLLNFEREMLGISYLQPAYSRTLGNGYAIDKYMS